MNEKYCILIRQSSACPAETRNRVVFLRSVMMYVHVLAPEVSTKKVKCRLNVAAHVVCLWRVILSDECCVHRTARTNQSCLLPKHIYCSDNLGDKYHNAVLLII